MDTEVIRIAHIVGKWVGGGVESVIMNYYYNIDHKKIQFDFICDEDSTNIPYEEIEKVGGKVILIPPYQSVFSYQKKLKAVLKKNKYLIVHSHINTLSIFPLKVAKRVGIKIRIAHSHSTTNKKEVKKNLLKIILRPFSKLYATHYICCSELAGRWLFGDKEYNKGSVYLLNNAISIEKFKYNKMLRINKRKELGISEDTLVIGHIGRFVEQKNHRFLIDIFNEIYQLNKKIVLVLVGQGPLQEEMQNIVKLLGLNDVVKFLGQRNDVEQLYQVFDVFLLPSLYEGLPVVGIEAQTSGLYCLFSDEMTKETKVIESTRFMSLSESSKDWANVLLNDIHGFVRTDTGDEITKKSFNIKEEGKKLEQYYMNLILNK